MWTRCCDNFRQSIDNSQGSNTISLVKHLYLLLLLPHPRPHPLLYPHPLPLAFFLLSMHALVLLIAAALLDTYTSLTLKVGDFVNNDGTEHKLPLLTGLCFSIIFSYLPFPLFPLLLLLLLLLFPLLHLLLLILHFVSLYFTSLYFTLSYLTLLHFTSLHSIRDHSHCVSLFHIQHPTRNLC